MSGGGSSIVDLEPDWVQHWRHNVNKTKVGKYILKRVHEGGLFFQWIGSRGVNIPYDKSLLAHGDVREQKSSLCVCDNLIYWVLSVSSDQGAN